MTKSLEPLLREVRACTLCSAILPLGPRPVVQAAAGATLLIAGQAPGTKVHETGIPFNDPSGDRLREWMGIDRETFYDPARIAILPMAFCYPGRGKSGDLPPPPICAETWRQKLLDALPSLKLTLLVGQYALRWHLGPTRRNLTETVRHWQEFPQGLFPLPHPSPRNNIWLKKNPWFEHDVVPALRERVSATLR